MPISTARMLLYYFFGVGLCKFVNVSLQTLVSFTEFWLFVVFSLYLG